MNTIEYINLKETKTHVSPSFPYNTYMCSIPLDFLTVPPHWHEEFEIIIIKKGIGMVSVDTELNIVKEHDIIFVRPGQLHSILQYHDAEMEYENIIFDVELLFSQQQDLCTYEYFRPYLSMEYEFPWHVDDSFSEHQFLYSCIENIDYICDHREKYYELRLKSNLFELFYLFFSNRKELQPATQKKTIGKVKQMITHIQENYFEELTVESMASLLGFSESHFMKFFKQNMNTTFTNYLNDYRLTIAGRLLLTTEASILDISEQIGFRNLSYFNRLFKKKYLQTPRDYRNR